jgi:hypothetical protein
MTRSEHLAWCKKRALEYVDKGDTTAAYSSMVSDMRKHDDLKDHSAIQLGLMLMVSGDLQTPIKMRDFINGFN